MKAGNVLAKLKSLEIKEDVKNAIEILRTHLPDDFVAYNGVKWPENHIKEYNKIVDEINKAIEKGEKIPSSLIDKSCKLFNLYCSK